MLMQFAFDVLPGISDFSNCLHVSLGLTTVLSGYFSGPPILISPESAAGIKAGAKTGVSTLVCGILFAIATFFYPIFAAVPAAGTAPLLIMVGVMLFANVKVRFFSLLYQYSNILFPTYDLTCLHLSESGLD